MNNYQHLEEASEPQTEAAESHYPTPGQSQRDSSRVSSTRDSSRVNSRESFKQSSRASQRESYKHSVLEDSHMPSTSVSVSVSALHTTDHSQPEPQDQDKDQKYEETPEEKKKLFLKKFYAMAIGNIMEWFDFSTFGALADILGENFFPSTDSKLIQLLEAMAVFGAAFLTRPLGGVLLGRIGDTIGRKKALELSIVMMLFPSFLIGCLPTYKQINWVAPMLLVTLRLLQGLAAGGEMVGAFLFTLEATEGRNTGFWGGSCKASGNFGTTLGMGLVTLLRLVLTREQLSSWGWRLPFWISILFGVIGVYARKNIKNNEEGHLTQNQVKKPLKFLMKNYHVEILLVIFIAGLWGCLYYTYFIWMAYFLQESSLIGENDTISSYAWSINFFGNLILVCMLPIGGWFGDRIIKKHGGDNLVGHQTALIYAVVMVVVLVIPSFMLILTKSIPCIVLGYLFLVVPISIYGSNLPGLIILLFNVNLRYTGVGIAYNLAGAIFSSTTSIIQTSLVMSGRSEDSNSSLFLDSRLRPAFYILFIAFLCFHALTYGIDYCIDKKRRLITYADEQECESEPELQKGSGPQVELSEIRPEKSVTTSDKLQEHQNVKSVMHT